MSRKKVLLLIIILFLATPCVGCGLLYVRDWYNTESKYQDWLQSNNLRVDWGHFKSSLEAKDAILKQTPIGSQEEELQDFYLANVDGATIDNWDPQGRSYYFLDGKSHPSYCPNSQECLRVKIDIPRVQTGHFFQRYLADRWIVFFYLNPDDHTLIDVGVKEYGILGDILIALTLEATPNDLRVMW